MRELKTTQEAFRTLAGRLDGGDPLEAWARTKAEHPAPGELIGPRRQHVDELATFLQRHDLISMPAAEADHRRADPGFLSLVVCEHVDVRARSRASRRAPTTI